MKLETKNSEKRKDLKQIVIFEGIYLTLVIIWATLLFSTVGGSQ